RHARRGARDRGGTPALHRPQARRLQPARREGRHAGAGAEPRAPVRGGVRSGGLEARARAIEASGGRGLNSDECSTGRRVISWWVALRAFFWSALFVGIVAVYIPTRYFALAPSRAWDATPAGIVGLLGIGAGTLVIIACVTEFATRGRG